MWIQTWYSPKTIVTDNGYEFLNLLWENYYNIIVTIKNIKSACLL